MGKIKFDLNIKTTDGVTTVPILFYPSYGNEYSVGEHTGLAVTSLPDSVSIVEIPMGAITEGIFLYAESDQVVSFYTNSDTNDPQIGTRILLVSSVGDGFTKFYIKNNSGVVATIKYILGGDPV